MLSQVGCAEEDAEVHVELGYPPVYAKLCRHEDAAGLPIPFTEGPPQRFLPYAPHAEDFLHLKDWDSLFPVVAEKERDTSTLRKFAEELWQQLDHLGNAGFDPSNFRVDPYGNVVYWNADPSSPLAWEVDHWFPSSRGGKTKLPNLRIVQWQAFLRKRNRLEFLVPWWDLQHGCSINQFLSAFAAKNADFRKRSFALFFAGGENESVAREHVGDCRPWPQHFREKKALCGLAAAAIVSSVDSKADNNNVDGGDAGRVGGPRKGTQSKRHWSVEEEEAVRKGVSKFGPGSWKEIKAADSALANRSAVQIKEKFRLMRGVSRHNHGASSTCTGRSDLAGRQSAATTALQKELRVKIMREEERREREEELTQLEETVMKLKLENEKERVKALELESLLKKRKHHVEKHRKLAESQSSYRLCLERVLRDTMHQAMAYKEQALLTQEACNVLIARLDSQNGLAEAVEGELLRRHVTRETLEAAGAGTPMMRKKKKVVSQGRDLVDVSSCVSLRALEDSNEEVLSALSDTDDEGECDEVCALRREHDQQQATARKSLVRHAIKVAMQVDDTKEAVDMALWQVPIIAKPPCSVSNAEYMLDPRTRVSPDDRSEGITARSSPQQYDANSETPVSLAESSSDSDFADDEMSPAVQISRSEDTQLVSELSKFHDGPTSELRDFCTRNSKPGERDFAGFEDHGHDSPAPEPGALESPLESPIQSAGDTSRSDSKREVQKDVIVVQSESTTKPPSYESIDTAAMYKQAYLDELLQQIRFQIPTPEVKGLTIQGHVDELLEQVLTTHLENLRRNNASRQQVNPDLDDDEKVKQIGKSNLDKWLHALLLKGMESAGSSPGRDTPVSSQISVAAMRESLQRARHDQELVVSSRDGKSQQQAARPKSLRGALLRKLSVQQYQSELDSSLFDPNDTYDVDRDAGESPSHRAAKLLASPGRPSGGESPRIATLPGWPGGIPLGGAASDLN